MITVLSTDWGMKGSAAHLKFKLNPSPSASHSRRKAKAVVCGPNDCASSNSSPTAKAIDGSLVQELL